MNFPYYCMVVMAYIRLESRVTFSFTMLRLLLLILITISGALAIPSFIVQHRGDSGGGNECRFKTQESSVLSAGTYVFQQLQPLEFDFVMTVKGECPDPPLVFLRDSTSISMAGSMTTGADTIRLSGEISEIGKQLILIVPSTETCDFKMQQHSSLSLELPNCRVGDQFPIDFEPSTTQSETDLMNDFVDLLDDPQDVKEIPDSISGLLLIDGIRDYVRYDYKTQWENLSNDLRTSRRASAYRQIRYVYLKIEPFITGDLSQQKEAEDTAQAACAHLNSLIENRKHYVDFKTLPLSGFNRKWKKFAPHQLPTFPQMIIKSKESRLGQCLVSSRKSAVLSPGTYVFGRLLQIEQLQSLRFHFEIKSRYASCLDLPSVSLRDSNTARGVGTTST